MESTATERRFKLVVLGTTGVGKTCLTLRFVKGMFDLEEEQLPTIGAAYMTKKINLDDVQYMFEIWDTAGQERYRAITPLYYRGANAAIIVFDLTDEGSFTRAKDWLKRLRTNRENVKMPIALAGNKTDMDRKAVDAEAITQFATENGLKYFETSAKTGKNVDAIFTWVAQNLPPPDDSAMDPNLLPLNEDNNQKKPQCC